MLRRASRWKQDPVNQAPPNEAKLAAALARRLPFFYGWVIVIICFLCVFIMGATSFWALPVFVGPMHEDEGWSHTLIFAGLSVHFLVSALGGLFVGGIADRRGGAAKLLLIGVVVDALALISLRWVDSPAQFIIVYGIIGGAGGTSIRLVQATLISKWFVARRGSAVGFASNGGSISALVMVPLTAFLIDAVGWRDAWALLGVIALLVLLPLVPFVVRSPEDIGLEPDNGVVPKAGVRSAASERSFTVREVLHIRQFWLLLIAVLVGNYSLQTHTVVMVPHVEDIGFTAQAAATALSAYGLFSLGMRFVWGALADQRGVRVAIIGQSLMTAVGAYLLMQIGGTLSLYFVIAFQGLSMSGFPPLQIMVWPEFFGRAHIGSIIGLTQPFTTVAGSFGPIIAGFLFDQTGSYNTALWMLVGTWVTCSLLMVIATPARPLVKSQPAL